MRLVSLVFDTRLNTLMFKFLTTSGTHFFAHGLLIFLQLPPHVLDLKGKNTKSSQLKLTICGLVLHF